MWRMVGNGDPPYPHCPTASTTAITAVHAGLTDQLCTRCMKNPSKLINQHLNCSWTEGLLELPIVNLLSALMQRTLMLGLAAGVF